SCPDWGSLEARRWDTSAQPGRGDRIGQYRRLRINRSPLARGQVFSKGSLVDISDGHTPGQSWLGRQAPAPVADPAMSRDDDAANLAGGPRTAPLHPRLLAMMMAARYFGLELDPAEFRLGPGETAPGASALSEWAKNAGMWSRALRLRWRHLMGLGSTGPVVLLFNDGTAGLLTGANAEARIVALKDPRAPGAEAAIMVGELRLAEVWDGD